MSDFSNVAVTFPTARSTQSPQRAPQGRCNRRTVLIGFGAFFIIFILWHFSKVNRLIFFNNIPTWKLRPRSPVKGEGMASRLPAGLSEADMPDICWNTVQGRRIVTDSRGAICKRSDVAANGCCQSSSVVDFLSCKSCRQDIKCCSSFEYCVACCLDSKKLEGHSLDEFDACLHTCRTSSRSLKGGNKYRSALRFCYSDQLVDLELANRSNIVTLPAQQGTSCSDTCVGIGSDAECLEEFLPLVNTCDAMQQHFPCTSCESNAGPDQPAMVSPDAPSGFSRGACLTNGDPDYFDCDGSHPHTQRLCVCINFGATAVGGTGTGTGGGGGAATTEQQQQQQQMSEPPSLSAAAAMNETREEADAGDESDTVV